MNSQVMGEEKPVFSADDRHDIIDHFRQTPWLWDTSDHNYKNQRARTKSLMQLAELLSQKKGFEIDVSGIRKIWENMRKQYNREKQMRRSNGRKERKTWPFYEYMTFLDGIQENLSTPKKLQERLSKPKLSTQTPKFKSTKDDSLDQLFEMLYSTDVEPFVKNIDVVYKKLLSEDMKSKAFEMKKKFTALAEQYESFLYADEDN